MSAESHYLDAIEAEENGELEQALEHARLAVKADPEHSNAWWMIVGLLAPDGKYPDIDQASKALVACNRVVDLESGRLPAVGSTVDLETATYTNTIGESELAAVWTDPEFDPQERAFYYVRVLENPVCRWSTWDALRAGVEPRSDLPKTIQERAWSSPIWLSSKSKEEFFEQ